MRDAHLFEGSITAQLLQLDVAQLLELFWAEVLEHDELFEVLAVVIILLLLCLLLSQRTTKICLV